MDRQHKITIFETPAELTVATAALIVTIAKEAIEARGRFVIALSGGHTPEQLYGLLSKPPFNDQITWDKTFLFWGDERCVPSDDKQNNARMAKTLLLDHVAIPPSNVYPVPVDMQPAEAAIEYEKTIKHFFQEPAPCFDLILLGLGENGHTASLFPNTEVLNEQDRLVKEVYIEEQKMFRITMTAPLINRAHTITFLVTGKPKAEILSTILNGPYQPKKYPAQLIKPEQGKLYWFVDSEAAAFL